MQNWVWLTCRWRVKEGGQSSLELFTSMVTSCLEERRRGSFCLIGIVLVFVSQILKGQTSSDKCQGRMDDSISCHLISRVPARTWVWFLYLWLLVCLGQGFCSISVVPNNPFSCSVKWLMFEFWVSFVVAHFLETCLLSPLEGSLCFMRNFFSYHLLAIKIYIPLLLISEGEGEG